MLKKGRKILMAAVAGAAMLAATPANAWYVVTYTTASGAFTGAKIYCNGGGDAIYSTGYETPYYTIEYHEDEYPC